MKSILKVICCSFTSFMLYACKKVDNIVNANIVTDVDKNTYHIITIGKQQWLQENLRTTLYQDGTPINNLPNQDDWNKNTDGSWCNYGNNADTGKLVGKLYNWYAVNNPHGLCPNGWIIPDTTDWRILTNELGGENEAWLHLKAVSFWNMTYSGEDNSSGFTGFPAGGRGDRDFNKFGSFGAFWSSTIPRRSGSNDYGYAYILNSSSIELGNQVPLDGYSCRCIKK